MNKHTVLVVDDSIVMRRIITDLLSSDQDLEVVGAARNGLEALEKVRTLNPDVVTMDIEMPVMDGLTSLQHIMAEFPRPVVMLSSMDKRQADITFKALELGAVEFIPKTSGSLSLDLERVGEQIDEIVKLWKAGDADGMDEAMIGESLREEPRVAPILEKILFERNVTMTEKIKEHLSAGRSCFVVVGAAHFVGDRGIVRLLEKEGYRVRQF